MHELALCSAIADAVRKHAEGRTVETVHITIGHFRQIVPDTLRFCWQVQTEHNDLAGTELDITFVDAVIRCSGCGSETRLSDPVMICAACGSHTVELIAGEEFLIESISLARPIPDTAVT